MGIDKSKYIGKFVEEGFENISTVETLLFEIKEGSSVQDDLVTLMRALHTLKGSARMLEFRNIETLSHTLETVFSALKEERISLNDKAIRLLLAGLDDLKTGLSLIKSGEQDAGDPALLLKELTALSANEDFTVPVKASAALPAEPDIKPAVPVSEEKALPEAKLPAKEVSGEQPKSARTAGTIDKSKYIGKFVEEGFENISTVETLLFEIKEGSSVQDDLVTLMRALHTLKGSARMLEFKGIETVSHTMETVFSALKEERISLNDKSIRLLLAGLDELKTGLNKVKSGNEDDIRSEIFQKEFTALSANEDFDVPAASEVQPSAAGESTESEKKPVSSEQLPPKIDKKVSAGVSKRNKLEEAKSESIRISLERINEIIHSMAALQSLEITARNIARDTETINEASRQFSRLISAEQSWNSPLLREFRSIELLTSKLGSLVKNYALDVGNHIRGAYDSVISLRMLPLSTALDAYPRYVFNIASELGKQVQIKIEGSENEIDKNLIESLSEVFLHMIRNSIDHGIESPEERRAAGKDETGQLTIRCVRESGNMKVTIADDGKGINVEGIRKKIVDKGLISAESAAILGEEELINYIFQSGFSTAEKLSNVSGRGVGMDAVRNNIELMKGSIAIQTRVGEGTVFIISVPLSMASLMGFPITSCNMKFIIPANFVDTVMLVDAKDIITVVDRPGIKYNGRIIKLFYLHHILKIHADEKKNDSDSVFVVIVQAYEETVALAVNQISSMRQVILKTMPSFIEQMDVFSGVVLSEDYEMVPALHIPTVIKMARRTKTIDMKKRHVDFERMRKSILVVDDSRPTRDIERDILEAEGYKVDTAADGSEALAAAKNVQYDLICTDIAMPNMDGFMLTENIRKNDQLKDIPIIVISSRTDEKDQNRAALLGANRYIVKNSFNNHNLVAAVRELIGEANG
ncbi:MAG: Hpt domain-containing protein [Treponema sp.]|nr:Hpt domain-containing protein [Treponema sp.]